jgi:hypothetical protein
MIVQKSKMKAALLLMPSPRFALRQRPIGETVGMVGWIIYLGMEAVRKDRYSGAGGNS